MPTYPIKNKETGETKELCMSMSEYEQWRNNNPDWDKDWQAGVAVPISEVGDWRNKVPAPVREKLQSIKRNHYGSTIHN